MGKNTDYGFDKMSADALRKVIADLAKDTVSLTDDKKEYNAGVNEILKDNKKKTKAAVQALLAKEKELPAEINEKVNAILRSV